MEREANFVAVGAFIVLVIAMAVTFLLWYNESRDAREYERYEILFRGSVSGLDRGSSVRYLGVDVGRVRALRISRDHPGSVRAIIEIDQAAPITGATKASLGLQGVTGLLYIDLKQSPDADPATPLKKGYRHPLIPAEASNFDVFLASLPELMGRANDVVERMTLVFSDENLAALSATLTNLSASTRGLPATADNAAALITDMREALIEVQAAAVGLRGIAEDSRPQIRQAMQRFGEVAANLEAASARVDAMVADSEQQLQQFSNRGLFEIEQLVRETRSAAREFRSLARSLQDNPSQLLYEQPQRGVRIEP